MADTQWVVVVVAATDRAMGSVLAASLMLPGMAILPLSLQAQNLPEHGLIALKMGYFSDSQPGWERVSVRSPQLYALVPIAGEWSLEGSLAGDSVSGATPRMHTFESGATPHMDDYRRAADVKVTRHFARAAVSAGIGFSSELDYKSRALNLQARLSSEDNNTTWAFGYGGARDVIDNQSIGGGAIDQSRRTDEWMVGLTQVMTADDIVQINLTRSVGAGYFNDPYKDFEDRPGYRNVNVALLRWNHYMDSMDASVRASYRLYGDSFGVKSQTLGIEWSKSFHRWTWVPGLRAYSQTAADFYFDPVVDGAGVPSVALTRRFANRLTGHRSADQRLAAYGALAISMKVAFDIDSLTQLDLKVESYRQRSDLQWGGDGSPHLESYNARSLQVGLVHKF